MKNREFKNGQIYIAFVRYAENINSDKPEGKVRPVVIFEDTEENKFYACKVSTKNDKPSARKLGYLIEDWKEAGLKSPSFVSCDKENVREIEPNSIRKLVGQLTERDIRGMLIKHIQVMQLEQQKEMDNSLER